jgi:hypothetical protein
MRLRRTILPLLLAAAFSCNGCRDRKTKAPPPAAVPSVQVITDPAEIAAARKAWADSREQTLASLLANPAGFSPYDDESKELLRSQRDRSLASLTRTRDDRSQPADRRIGASMALAALGTAADPARLAGIATDDESTRHLLWNLSQFYKTKAGLPTPLRQVVVRALTSKNEQAATQAAFLTTRYGLAEAGDVVLERVRSDPSAGPAFLRAAASLRPTAEVLDAILKRAHPANHPAAGETIQAVADLAKATSDPALRRRAADACLQYLKQKPDGPSVDSGTFDALDTLAKAVPADPAKAALADVVRTAKHKYVREYALDRLQKLDAGAATQLSAETKVKLPEPAAASPARSLTAQQAADVCVRHKLLTRAEADAALAALAAKKKPPAKPDGADDEDPADDDVPAFLYAAKRFAAFDVETGLLPNRHDRLILEELADAGAGQFKPEAALENYVEDKPRTRARGNIIVESEEDVTGTYTVQFIHAGRLYRFNPRDLGDWYDVSAVLLAANRALADAGSPARFVPLETGDQTAALVCCDPAALRAAAPELDLKLSTDADDARKQGKAYEDAVVKKLKENGQ